MSNIKQLLKDISNSPEGPRIAELRVYPRWPRAGRILGIDLYPVNDMDSTLKNHWL